MARALLVLLLLASAGALRAAIDPANTAVVANGNVPEGVALARDFMRHRGIPERHLIVLDLPKDEAIDWHTYAETLLNPLRAKLLAAGLLTGELTEPQDARGRKEYLPTTAPKLSWLVLVHGVPLKLRASGTKPAAAPRSAVRGDQACVDSELALLATVNLDPEGAKPNPWFRTISPAPADAAEVVRIARLDGPTAADVRRALAGAWQAEARGLRGRAYIDVGGPYADGDAWFKDAAERTRRLGFPTDVESTPKQFGRKARADAPAFYLGWYSQKPTGRFAEEAARLAPGAIALHLHSFSAETLRDPAAGWTPWLVRQGAAHTSGNVHEPYLPLTLRPDLLVDGLAQGLTAGEAAWFATPAVSWQGVILGDPFYRPLGRTPEEQVADFRRAPDELGAYALLRAAQLRGATEPDQARADLKAAQERFPALPLAFARAQADPKQPIAWPEPPGLAWATADSGLLWEIGLFAEKNAFPDLARRAWEALAARPDWKDDPELRAHLPPVGR